MKNFMMLLIAGIAALSFSTNSIAGETHIGRSVKHSAKAVSHGSASAGHAIAGSAQVASAVAAVPFLIVGSAGAVSIEIAEDLLEAASAPAGAPLEITDESVTAGPPPDKVLISD